MIDIDTIDNLYGVGHYLLINCSDSTIQYLNSQGYLTTSLQSDVIFEIDWEIIKKSNLPFDFIVIDNLVFNDLDQIATLFDNIKNIFSEQTRMAIFFNHNQGAVCKTDVLDQMVTAGFREDISFIAEPKYSLNNDTGYYVAITLEYYPLDTTLYLTANELYKQTAFCESIKYLLRQNERVAVVGLDEGIADSILNRRTAIRECHLFPHLLQFSDFLTDDISLNGPLDDQQVHYPKFDCIVIYYSHDNDISEIMLKIIDNMTPGGRLIISRPTAMSISIDPAYFDLEAVFGCCNRFSEWTSLNVEEMLLANLVSSDYDFITSCYMKNPFIDYENFKYKEINYQYSYPPENLLAFERDYINPWIVKAMVEFPFRNKISSTLEKYAKYILSNYDALSPDYGAALAIIGYQRIGNSIQENESDILNIIMRYCSGIVSLPNASPHQIRWLISLYVLSAELYKSRGQFDLAMALYLKAIDVKYETFSSTIGTKILQSYYNLAVMFYSRKEYLKSEESAVKGILEGYKILSVPALELYGDINKPLQFTLYIYHDIVDWLIKLTNAKNLLSWKSGLLKSINSNSWSSVISERLKIINKMDSLVREKDSAIKSQAEILDDRFEAIKTMDAMISEKDQVIEAQADMLQKRFDIIKNMDLMIKERDEAIKAQANIIDERWQAMKAMEKMIAERDNNIRNLENIISNSDINNNH
ncbi:hypothetical protein [Biostraticola tofi]|uniref:Tetratricopeptide repeat protein n=1 Tax=Biostraticola tofi TaxID=466109 RepID=A0A4R3Z359_9GAMM|nr:hypothetical protein [Biostraticola tofi]TCV98283.1 hypothetical protein EDC52_103375 [Biostraticola tofi]